MERTLNPHQLDFYASLAWTWSVAFLPRLITTVILLIAGFLISGWAARNLRSVLARSGRIDATVQPVLAAMARYAILIFVFVAALSQIGVQTASLFAILGAAGLAIGLALQGTLTNIAAGIMLLWLRPFHLGDYIEVPANNISGTVREIGLFACLLETFEGISIFAPNSAIWNSALRNHSRSRGRLVSLSITLPSSPDAEKAMSLLRDMLINDDRISKAPTPIVFIESDNGPNGMIINCSFRVNYLKVGELQRTVIAEIERQLKAKGNENLVPRQIVRTLPADSDPSRLLASQNSPNADSMPRTTNPAGSSLSGDWIRKVI